MQLLRFILSILVVSLISCNPVYQAKTVQYKDYRVYNLRTDSTMNVLLKPFSDSIRNSMSEVIVTLENDLEKSQPEGTLGNMMADAMYIMAERTYGKKPDAAFMNYGGIRLPVVKAGAVTRGKIFELFPFDNILVLLTIKGDLLQQFLDHISGRGGWPVAGITMKIRNKKAVDVKIAGKQIDPSATYTIVVGDYTANGGDDASMLVGIPQQNNGYLMRDAILEYLKSFRQSGKTFSLQLEKRVVYVD